MRELEEICLQCFSSFHQKECLWLLCCCVSERWIQMRLHFCSFDISVMQLKVCLSWKQAMEKHNARPPPHWAFTAIPQRRTPHRATRHKSTLKNITTSLQLTKNILLMTTWDKFKKYEFWKTLNSSLSNSNNHTRPNKHLSKSMICMIMLCEKLML